MENIDIIVEERVIEVTVDGGRGPQGINTGKPWVKVGDTAAIPLVTDEILHEGGVKVKGTQDGFINLKQSNVDAGGFFFKHKPNEQVGKSPLFTMAVGATDPTGFNYLNHSDYVFSLGLNMPDSSLNDDIDPDRGGISINMEGYFDGNVSGNGSQEFHLVHYAVPNSSSLRFMTSRIFEDRTKGGDIGFNIGNNTNASAFYVNDQNLNPKWSLNWVANKMVLHNGLTMLVQTNNVAAIQQRDNASGSFNLVGLDSQNRTWLHSNNFFFENGQIMHTNASGFQLGSNTSSILQAPLFVSSAQDNLLRLRRSDVADEFQLKGSSAYFAYTWQGKNILHINNAAPTNQFTIGQNSIGVGGFAPFGKFSVIGQESNINISMFGCTGGDGLYYNGTGTNFNLLRGDVSMSNKVRMPLQNTSSAANSAIEVNFNSSSSTGKAYASFGNSVSGNYWQFGVDKAVNGSLRIYRDGDKFTSGNITAEFLTNGGILLSSLKTADDDTAAGVAGAITNELYKTTTGNLKIKL